GAPRRRDPARPHRLSGRRRERGRLPRGGRVRHRLDAVRRRRADAPNQPGSRGVEVPMDLALDTLRLPRAAEAATMPAVAVNDCTDGELIRRTGDGDRSAFEVLYRRYARPVFGLALRRLGDRGRAEDAVQETFASIWRAARSYRP